jgi:hypothetical protein
MPMNPQLLAQEMLAAIGGQPNDDRRKAFEALANAIVAHIVKNAQVLPGITVKTTGTAAAQDGATTAPGKIA